MMSIVRLHWAAGQTCILQRQPPCKFPKTVEEFGRHAVELLREIMKCQVIHSLCLWYNLILINW